MGLKVMFLLYFIFFFSASSASNVNSKHLENLDEKERDIYVYQRYVELDKDFKRFVNSKIKAVMPYIMEESQHVRLSSSCAKDLFHLISDIRKLKLPAWRLLDSIGKIPGGVLDGTISMLGDYDECMATTVRSNDGNVAFKGQYCMVYLKPLFPSSSKSVSMNEGYKGFIEATKNTSEVMQYVISKMHFVHRYYPKLGICVPSGCSFEDIDSIAKYVSDKVIINATVKYCDQHYDNPVSTGRIIAMFFFSLVGLLCIMGTFMDYCGMIRKISFKNRMARLLQCFSVLKNFPKVISTKITENSLSSLFGIRALSVFNIILLHQYFFTEIFSFQGHLLVYETKFKSFSWQIIVNGFLTTEVFFFIGGLVNSYSSMKVIENGKRKIGYAAVIVHRLIRVYPPYLFCILSIYIIGNTHGPIRTLAHQTHWEKCDRHWWQNLLFINNFLDQDETCFFQGWYIAADMHLFLISVFTVPVFAKNPKRGALLHLGILVVGLVSTSLWAWHKNILPGLIAHISEERIKRVRNAYTMTLPHIAPYFAGLLFGYFLSAYKDFKIPLIYRLIGWPVASLSFLSMLFVTQRWNTGVEPTILETVLYFSFSKLIYVLAVGWMVVCCVRGYGGIINYILSLKVWIPISRLSYMMFLISPVIQGSYTANLRMAIDSDEMVLIWQYMGDLTVSFFLALLLVIMVESPFIAMEKIIFGRKSTEEMRNVKNQNPVQVNSISEEKGCTAIEIENNIKNTILELPLKKEIFM